MRLMTGAGGGGGSGNKIPRARPSRRGPRCFPVHPRVRAPHAPTFRALPALAHGGCRHIARGGGGDRSRKESRGRELAIAGARATGAQGAGERAGTLTRLGVKFPHAGGAAGGAVPKPCVQPAGPAACRALLSSSRRNP